jgi:hypothetical protein
MTKNRTRCKVAASEEIGDKHRRAAAQQSTA